MKKLLAMILALAMVLGMATMVAAATIDNNAMADGSEVVSGAVTINVTPGTGAEVYKIDIDWSALTFTYNFGTGAEWDPEDHTYSGGTDAGWEEDTKTITVTNHTNAVVYATAGLTATPEKNNVQVTVDTEEKTLADAADASYGAPNSAPSATIEVTVSGVPTVDEPFTIEAVKVPISSTPAEP